MPSGALVDVTQKTDWKKCLHMSVYLLHLCHCHEDIPWLVYGRMKDTWGRAELPIISAEANLISWQLTGPRHVNEHTQNSDKPRPNQLNVED